jgi:DNA-directed RNA polymerase subunit RPC12/RpoP
LARLVKAQCPTCGAGLALDPSRDWITCTYCSTSVLIQRSTQHAPPPPGYGPPTIFVPPPRSTAATLIPIVVILAVIMSASVAGMIAQRGGIGGSGNVVLMGHPLTGDANGDGSADLVSVGVRVGGEQHAYYAFEPHTGQKLWQTEPFGSSISGLSAAISMNRLLVAERATLHGHDLATGARVFSRPLHEASSHFCEHGGRMTLVTKDEVMHAIDLTNGGLAPLGKAGRAHSEGLPCIGVGTFAKPSGFVEVNASDYSSGVAGMSVRTAVRIGSSVDLLLLGYRSPGSRTPMIALWSNDGPKWSTVVPATDPLQAKEGAPEGYAALGDRIVVSYDVPGQKQTRIVCFERQSGRRLWEAVLAPATWHKLALTERYVLFANSPSVTVFSLTDGKRIRVLGLKR